MVDSTNLSEVDINQIATDLNGKMDRDGINAIASVCIESWHDENGNWYRVYSDGWCEQGGRANGSTSDVPFLQAFKDTNYNLQIRYDYNNSGTMGGVYWYAVKTTTKFTTGAHSTSLPFDWVAEGYIR